MQYNHDSKINPSLVVKVFCCLLLCSPSIQPEYVMHGWGSIRETGHKGNSTSQPPQSSESLKITENKKTRCFLRYRKQRKKNDAGAEEGYNNNEY